MRFQEKFRPISINISRLLLVSLLFLSVAGCASRPYEGVGLHEAPFLSRSISQENTSVVVMAAVPDAAETLELTGIDLYSQGIQPVWLSIQNNGEISARLAQWSIDPDYFSPIEVAYMNRKPYNKQGYANMERWFHDNGMQRHIPAGETRSGLVFTHLTEGTKGINLDIFSGKTTHAFTFFVPMPGFVPDFMTVDFSALYEEQEIRDLDLSELKIELDTNLQCCATSPDGTSDGFPLNVALVGSGLAVRKSMLRGRWRETSTSSVEDERARKQHYMGRRPDAIFSKYREDGNEKMQLQLWVAPQRVEGQPVWVGQVFYWSDDVGGLLDPILGLGRTLSTL
jgi:hypothetical protein